MAEDLLEVQVDERSEIGIDVMSFVVFDPIGEVHFFVCQVINCNLEVARVEAGDDLSHCHFGCDYAVIFGEEFMQSFVEGRAKPVHTVVDRVFNGWVPVLFGERIGITNHIAD